MKILIVAILVTLSIGCSSSYTPSEKMLEYKKNMTSEQAIEVLQKAIWDIKGSKGICGSRGFWYDDASNMKVHKDKISLLSHKRGKQLKKIEHGFNGVVVFEKQYLRFDFEFNKVNAIYIYDDPLLLPVFPTCNKNDEMEDYFIIDLFGDKLTNLKFTILEKELDKTMAAISIIFTGKPIESK